MNGEIMSKPNNTRNNPPNFQILEKYSPKIEQKGVFITVSIDKEPTFSEKSILFGSGWKCSGKKWIYNIILKEVYEN